MVDTSSYPTPQPYQVPQQPNALQTYGQVTDIGNKLLQQKQQQLGIQQQQLELANQHYKSMQDTFSALATNPNASFKDVREAATNLIAEGRATPQEVAQELGSLPNGADSSPQDINKFAQTYLMRSLDAQSKMNAAYGTINPVNQGGQITFPRVNQVTGAVTPSGGAVPIGLPPTATTMQGNQPTYVGGFIGGPASVQGGGAGTGAANLPVGAVPPVNASSLPPGSVAAGPALGAEAAANAAASKSGGSFADNLQASQGYNTRMFQLTNALEHVQKLGQTGPGTDAKNYLASFLQANTPGDLGKFLPGVDPTQIANYNEAKKYTTQFAQNRAQQFGGGTDAELATTLSSSPNVTSLDKLSNTDLLKANVAIENMNQAATLSAIQAKIAPQDFQKFAAQWGNSVDPRAFAIDLLPKDKQAELVKGLSAAERPKFAAGLRAMKENNITIPNAQNLTGE